jgi:hypothetical protein
MTTLLTIVILGVAWGMTFHWYFLFHDNNCIYNVIIFCENFEV